MFLNLHERWLLHQVGLGRAGRRALFEALAEDPGLIPGRVDLAAQVGGYTMIKRSVPDDLEQLFNRLMSPHELPVRAVAYGDRRYRRDVILAAALHQAGVSADNFRWGRASGVRELRRFATVSLRDVPN